MKKFIEKIEKICKENEKVAMFIDMDGTITVYDIYPENMVNEKMQEEYSQAEPAQYIIDILEKVNHIPNLDLYILSLSRTVKITKEKKKWLRFTRFSKKTERRNKVRVHFLTTGRKEGTYE